VVGSNRGEDYGGRGLVEVDATGTGCIFIKRQVLEDKELQDPFLDVFDEEGHRSLGLDINFCRRAKNRGYNVYVHTDYVASHWTDMDQKMVYKSMNDEGVAITQLGD
jgi:GT2 family glycosyltransferase